MGALGHLLMAAGSATPTPTESPSPSGTPCPCVTSTPAPDIVNVTAPWQLTLPLTVTIVLGIITAVGVFLTLLQKHRSDKRQQLWNRIQWALNAMTSDDEETALIGYLAVKHLTDSTDLPRKDQPPIKLTNYDVQLLSQSLAALD